VRLEKFLFKEFSGDFIERTRRDLGGGNAKPFGCGEHFLALQANLLGNVVDANWHKSIAPTALKRTAFS
jgi:hypothetical protein